MGFFDDLAAKISGYTLQMTISKNDKGELNVMLYPVVSEKELVQKSITPISITGTPDELDQGFFASLGVTLDKTKMFANQIKTFEANLEKAAIAANPKKTGTAAKPVTTKPAEPTLMDQKPVEVEQMEKKEVEPEVRSMPVNENIQKGNGPIEELQKPNDEFGDDNW